VSVSEDPCFSPVLELPRRRLFGFAVARLGDGSACLTAALQCASTWGGRDQPVVLLDAELDPDGAMCARLAAGLLAAPHPEAVVVRVPRFHRVDPASILEQLVERGVTVAVRDVDLGAAELGLLAGAPIDLHRAARVGWSPGSDRDPAAAAALAARIEVGHRHDWLALAWHVERATQLEALVAIDCDLIAGPVAGRRLALAEADRAVARYLHRAADRACRRPSDHGSRRAAGRRSDPSARAAAAAGRALGRYCAR
jgi:EAL domain-containing protein (putative c-di-GMP-specific phosphodiesterase class I)